MLTTDWAAIVVAVYCPCASKLNTSAPKSAASKQPDADVCIKKPISRAEVWQRHRQAPTSSVVPKFDGSENGKALLSWPLVLSIVQSEAVLPVCPASKTCMLLITLGLLSMMYLHAGGAEFKGLQFIRAQHGQAAATQRQHHLLAAGHHIDGPGIEHIINAATAEAHGSIAPAIAIAIAIVRKTVVVFDAITRYGANHRQVIELIQGLAQLQGIGSSRHDGLGLRNIIVQNAAQLRRDFRRCKQVG